MARVLSAAGVLLVALLISMLVVLFFEAIEALLGPPVALVVALAIAGGLSWSIAGLSGK